MMIAEYDGSNNLLRKFVYGPGIDEVRVFMQDLTSEEIVRQVSYKIDARWVEQ
jgi:hypothetical protein